MNEPTVPVDLAPWVCGRCHIALQPAKAKIAYLGNAFPVDLLTCPQCGSSGSPRSGAGPDGGGREDVGGQVRRDACSVLRPRVIRVA